MKAIQRTSFAAFALLALAHPAIAMPEAAKQETLKLIGTVESSGCQFERNGTWFPAKDAAAHLQRKLNATEKRLETTEQFITHVASTSSITGQPYAIRCGAETVQVKSWLEEKLKTVRSGG